MLITATELKRNLGKYPLLAAAEDIYITRKGRIVANLPLLPCLGRVCRPCGPVATAAPAAPCLCRTWAGDASC